MNGRSLRERPHPRPLQRQEEEEEEGENNKEECNNCRGEELWDQKQFSEDEETSDYVFRILTTVKPERFCKSSFENLQKSTYIININISRIFFKISNKEPHYRTSFC